MSHCSRVGTGGTPILGQYGYVPPESPPIFRPGSLLKTQLFRPVLLQKTLPPLPFSKTYINLFVPLFQPGLLQKTPLLKKIHFFVIFSSKFTLIFQIRAALKALFLARLNEVQLLYYPRRSRQHPQMLKFYVKVFRTSLFPNPLMDLVYIWYDDRYWSKILFSTNPTPMHDLKLKVTDLELLCQYFMLKFLGPHYFQTL